MCEIKGLSLKKFIVKCGLVCLFGMSGTRLGAQTVYISPDINIKNDFSYFILPHPNGTISFLWSNNSKESISVEIGNKHFSYFVELNSQDPLFYNNVDFNAKEANKLSDYIGIL